MSELEQDVEHVRAVTAAIAGPQEVWVVIVEHDHNAHACVFQTESSARAAIRVDLDDDLANEATTQAEHARLVAELDAGDWALGYEDGAWWTLTSEEVRP